MPLSDEECEARVALSDDVLSRGVAVEGRAAVLEAWSEKAGALLGLKRWAEALAAASEFLLFVENDEVDMRVMLGVMRVKVFSLERLGRLDEALAAAEEFAVPFEDDGSEDVRRQRVQVLIRQIRILNRLGRVLEAGMLVDGLVEQFDRDPDAVANGENVIASVLLLKARILRGDGRREDAVATLDDLLARFGDAPEQEMRVSVMSARNDRARLLQRLGHKAEAAASFRDVYDDLSNEGDEELRSQAVIALFGAATADPVGHEQQLVSRLGELIDRYGDLRPVGHRNVVADSMRIRALGLRDLGHIDRAISQIDDLLQRYGQSGDLAVLNVVAQAMMDKSRCLYLAGRHHEERLLLEAVTERFGDSSDDKLRLRAAEALFNEAVRLHERGSYADELVKWDDLDARFGADPPAGDPFIAIRGQVAKIGTLNWTLKRVDDALVTCEELIARCERSDANESEVKLAEVMALKRDCLSLARRTDAVLAANAAIIDRFDDSQSAEVQNVRDAAFVSTVNWGVRSGRLDLAIAASEPLADRFSTTPSSELAVKVLDCAKALAFFRSHEHAVIDTGARILTITAATIQNISATIGAPPVWLPAPQNRLADALSHSQRRFKQSLKLAELLIGTYQDDPDPTSQEILVAAQLATAPAFMGLGQPLASLRAIQTPIRADILGTSEPARGLHSPVPAEAMLYALATERLGDPTRTIAACDAFIGEYGQQRSPITQMLTLIARHSRRKARKAETAGT